MAPFLPFPYGHQFLQFNLKFAVALIYSTCKNNVESSIIIFYQIHMINVLYKFLNKKSEFSVLPV